MQGRWSSKSDFDAIENLRGDKFFKQALDIGLLPSSPTLLQRMDAHAAPLAGQVLPMIERLLTRHAPDYGVLPCRWLPLDIDTFAMDNIGIAKEGVDRTVRRVLRAACCDWSSARSARAGST